MYSNYLITGSTGFLGRTVTQELVRRGARVRALLLPDDPYAAELPQGVETLRGDICNAESLEQFFSGADRQSCLIHCAGIVSIASRPGNKLYQVNVAGTRNVARLCAEHQVGRMIYVSSVHAIPEKPKGEVMTEDCEFSPLLVHGEYAKSKAAATEAVFDEMRRGLRANVVFPSGIIGPGDLSDGSFTVMMKSFLAGKLPFSVKGGYDFVDVRDVAGGIADCSDKAEVGKGYILSGHYQTIDAMLRIAGQAAGLRHRALPLPLSLAKLAAPFYEKRSIKNRTKPFFTPYSVTVLGSNGLFSHAAATERFAYRPRPIEETLGDMSAWLASQVKVSSAD